jgi:translation initiation factor IF-3
LRINHEIRARELRLISSKGQQLGVVSLQEALRLAELDGLDLIEIVPTATPPVAKIMDYGKYRYDQTKREKESKKSQHQVKVKEIKLGPNISEHDLEVKLRQTKEFLQNGNKVKISVTFRGREVIHPEVGRRLMERVIGTLGELSMVEAPPKQLGRTIGAVLSPCTKKKATKSESTLAH